MGWQFWFGLLLVCTVILGLSKLGDIALDRGHFWLFMVLGIAGSGLLLALISAAKQAVMQ